MTHSEQLLSGKGNLIGNVLRDFIQALLLFVEKVYARYESRDGRLCQYISTSARMAFVQKPKV